MNPKRASTLTSGSAPSGLSSGLRPGSFKINGLEACRGGPTPGVPPESALVVGAENAIREQTSTEAQDLDVFKSAI